MRHKINFAKDVVELAYGAGGRSMQQLLEELIYPRLNNSFLAQGEDQAILPAIGGEIAFTSDSYVVSPYFFPGGDIGSLAVHGTINDLAVGGAIPLYLSLSLILEEGLPLLHLQKIIASIAKSAELAQVKVVTGDTKVVERGMGDGIFINMNGIGVINPASKLTYQVKLGDKIILNGNIAEHGVAIMSSRANLSFSTGIVSDSCPLHGLIQAILHQGVNIRCMRDPTRGGIAAALNEWAHKYQIGLSITEEQLPITNEVQAACELLGLDPLFIANEGKVLIVCAAEDSEIILQTLQSHHYGVDARIIGEVTSLEKTYVNMRTQFGGMRRIDWLSGEQLPRIC
ncbi:MAG: hydrogenase expression/formation protein HypE [Burkholderiales bacterium]